MIRYQVTHSDILAGFAALLLVVTPLSAGTINMIPGQPSARSEARVRFSETDWADSCPPVYSHTIVNGSGILIKLVPQTTCTPTPGPAPYSVITFLPRLDPGEYDLSIEAPDFTTGQPELSLYSFEVEEAVGCSHAQRPAASLLLPYFEVDLDNPENQRTLFSLGTITNEPTLAHVVVWTNWGWPRLTFDVVLPANGLKTFDVASILNGSWPATSPPSDGRFPSCTSPLTSPPVDPEEIRAQFTGQPSLIDGLCHSEPGGDPSIATGYITVDTVSDCSGTENTTPLGGNYFYPDGPTRLATDDNHLWGDFYLLSSAQDLAEGEALVPLFADEDTFRLGSQGSGTSNISFYRSYDHRTPLPHTMRGRFLDGGNFDADTDLLVWTEGSTGPYFCDEPINSPVYRIIDFDLYDQAGTLISSESITERRVARKFKIGEETPLNHPFGVVDVNATYYNGVIGVPYIQPIQTWMLPIVRAENRFGVATGSIPIEDFCRP